MSLPATSRKLDTERKKRRLPIKEGVGVILRTSLIKINLRVPATLSSCDHVNEERRENVPKEFTLRRDSKRKDRRSVKCG